MNNEFYIVATDDAARQRLQLQHQLYELASLALIEDACITSGMHGLEIGCGTGDMTRHLAKKLGQPGSLMSIDINDQQLQASEAQLKHCGATASVTFKNHCVTQLNSLQQTFDFIYCRMVLHHLSDAAIAIKHMIGCLRPGGKLIIEEPIIHEGIFCYPTAAEVETFLQWMRQCFTKNKRDFKMATRLHDMICRRDMKINQYSVYQPVLQTPTEKMIYAMTLIDLSPQLITHQIATQIEINALYQALTTFSHADHLVSWVRMHQVIATPI